MEPAKIDWKSIETEVFVTDETYEHINAPQWIDFLLPSPHQHHSLNYDESWFCRPDCNHPKTADDFAKKLNTSPMITSSKMLRSVGVSKLIGLGDLNSRDGNLKRRGLAAQSSTPSADEDGENQNPNVPTPPCQTKSVKAAIKSSAEKNWQDDNYTEILLRSNEKPRLKSTLSARDLFGTREIFSKVSEFCNELKKLAKRRTKQEDDSDAPMLSTKNSIKVELKEDDSILVEKLDEKVKEQKPLIDVGRERCDEEKSKERKPLIEVGITKGKVKRKKRVDDAENIIPLPLNMNTVKGEDQKSLLQIRTSPPTPQCFSAKRDQANTTLLKAVKSRLKDEEILQEVKKNKMLKEELEEHTDGVNASPLTAGRKQRDAPTAGKQGNALDFLWFLKPCTLSS